MFAPTCDPKLRRHFQHFLREESDDDEEKEPSLSSEAHRLLNQRLKQLEDDQCDPGLDPAPGGASNVSTGSSSAQLQFANFFESDESSSGPRMRRAASDPCHSTSFYGTFASSSGEFDSAKGKETREKATENQQTQAGRQGQEGRKGGDEDIEVYRPNRSTSKSPGWQEDSDFEELSNPNRSISKPKPFPADLQNERRPPRSSAQLQMPFVATSLELEGGQGTLQLMKLGSNGEKEEVARRYNEVRWTTHFYTSWDLMLANFLQRHFLDNEEAAREQTVHFVLISYGILVVGILIPVLEYMQSILIPLLLAGGCSMLLEPLVFLLMDPMVRVNTPQQHRPGIRGTLTENGMEVELTATMSKKMSDNPFDDESTQWTRLEGRIGWFIRRLWSVIAVGFVIGALILFIFLLGTWILNSVQSVDWKRYLDSPKIQFVRDALAEQGIDDFEEAMTEAAAYVIQAMGAELLESFLSILSRSLLTFLFLGFFLVDSARQRTNGHEPWRKKETRLRAELERTTSLSKQAGGTDFLTDMGLVDRAMGLMAKIRGQMKAWLMSKFWLSVLKVFIIGTMYILLKVDLWVIWTFLTFLLNFMPMGSGISTFAPLPLVLLDPDQPLWAAVVCVFFPFMVHSLIGNIVEPRVFSFALSLHPIAVLFALTFWSSLWGVFGALVCVPLTASMRVVVLEFQSHPYTPYLLTLFQGKFSHLS